MKAIVFLGPSLPRAEAQTLLDADFRPPVGEGDVYRAALDRPAAIGIVDGYFEAVPAVWHKEILFALSRGIHVFGASSMGALRAAELAAFGMEGVGEIFAAFAARIYEDDDEVAVLHGPAELGYPSASEAMVNIRASLAAAEAAGAILPDTRRQLEAAAKALFYRERNTAAMLEAGRRLGVAERQLARLQDFLVTGAVDLKRADARLLLAEMRRRLAVGLAPKSVAFTFEHTSLWERATQLAVAQPR